MNTRHAKIKLMNRPVESERAREYILVMAITSSFRMGRDLDAEWNIGRGCSLTIRLEALEMS